MVSRLGEIRPIRGLGLLVVAALLLSWDGGVLSPLPLLLPNLVTPPSSPNCPFYHARRDRIRQFLSFITAAYQGLTKRLAASPLQKLGAKKIGPDREPISAPRR